MQVCCIICAFTVICITFGSVMGVSYDVEFGVKSN
jgi:hypothetical protein